MTLLEAILLGGFVIMGIQSHAAQTAASETVVATGVPSQGTEDPGCVCAFPVQPPEFDLPCTENAFCVDLFGEASVACIDGFCFDSAGDFAPVECESDQICINNAGRDPRARCVRSEPFPLLFYPTDMPCNALPQNDPNAYCQGDPCVISGDFEVESGADLNFGNRSVVLEGALSIDDGAMRIRAGDFQISGQGQIVGSPEAGELAGGSVEIFTVGDIRIDGERESGAIQMVGDGGGSVFLESRFGSIHGGGDILVGSSTDQGDGGLIALTAALDINFSGSINGSAASEGSGGELEVTAEGSVALTGGIDLSGGFDGGLLFVETLGGVTLGEINLDGTGDRGNGGEIDIRAGGAVELGGAIDSRGSDLSTEDCGDGGRLSVEAGGDVTTLGEINVSALEGDCRGGEIELTGGTVTIDGPISFGGQGQNGFGGSLDVAANCQFASRAPLDGRAFDGGTVDVTAGCIMVTETIMVMETVMQMQFIGPLECDPIQCDPLVILIESTIIAGPLEDPEPRRAAPSSGGSISLSGCSVEIADTAQLVARGPGAFNRIVSRGDTTVAGDMMATSTNEFRFPPGSEPLITGQVLPAPALNADDSLEPCVHAETPTPSAMPTDTVPTTATSAPTSTPSSTMTPSESSTPGNTVTPTPGGTNTRNPTVSETPTAAPPSRTPTVSPTPSLAGPGDANCDGGITAADIPELVKLIPSNDFGDCGLADADQSGAVDEEDIAATLQLIFE